MKKKFKFLGGKRLVKISRTSFGDMLDFKVPDDCDLIVISTNRGGGWEPKMMCLPHQFYVEKLREMLKENPDCRWIGVHAINSKTLVDVWEE